MTRTVDLSTVSRAVRATAAAVLLSAILAACGGAASTPQPAGGAPTRVAGVTTAPGAVTPGAASAAPAAAGRTADPVLANALAKLNDLTSYKFKFTLRGGSYASSVGPAGVAGTVVNKPSFAVQFTYVDLEIIEIQGMSWTKNGSSWDPSRYPGTPTTYDSYGPAVLLSHYFTESIAAYCTAGGDETVNGVLATHYTIDPKVLTAMAAYWGVKSGATLAGDIWIAKSGVYPVRWKVTGTGTDAFQFLVEITNANDPANVIKVPAS